MMVTFFVRPAILVLFLCDLAVPCLALVGTPVPGLHPTGLESHTGKFHIVNGAVRARVYLQPV